MNRLLDATDRCEVMWDDLISNNRRRRVKKLLESTFTEKPLKSPPVVFSGVVELKKKRKYAECMFELYRHAGIFKSTIEVE